MRNQHVIQKSVSAASVLLLSAALAVAQQVPGAADVPAPAGAEPVAGAMRVGVFDVNQAFNAYPGVQRAQQRGQELQGEMQEASAAQDQARMGEIQQEFQQLQQRAMQEFQQDLQRALPDIASNAGVPLIVSEVAYAEDNLESVDLTGEVVSALREPAETPGAPEMPAGFPPATP